MSWMTSGLKAVNAGLHFDLFLPKQLTQFHLSSAIFNILDEETCAQWEGLKQQKHESGCSSDEQMSRRSTWASLWIIVVRFPTILFPAGICSTSKEEDEKESFLLQPSGNTSGCLTWDSKPQVKGAAANFCAFLMVFDSAQAVLHWL